MSEVSNIPNTVLLIKYQRVCQRCQRCETLCCTMNNWSKAIYVRGVKNGVHGFYTTLYTEYCYSWGGVEGVLYYVYSGLLPLPGGKAKHSILGV